MPINYYIRIVIYGAIVIVLAIVLPQSVYADVIIDNPHTSLELITSVRSLMNNNSDLDQVVESLNGILLMPPSEYTQEAKMLIGIAHEKQGNTFRAKHDYAAYIDEYPDSEKTQYIRQKLIALEIAKPATVIDIRHPRSPDIGSSSEISGSITSYYSSSSSTNNIVNWNTDQSSLSNSVSLTGTFKENEYSTKAVIRYSDLFSFYPNSAESSKISNAYISVNDTFRDYGIKIGRQNPLPGVLGRFDGLSITSKITRDLDIGIYGGVPYTGSTDRRLFYGANANLAVSGTTFITGYYNYQAVNGFTERSAFGAQVQYLMNDTTILANAEYDVLYKTFGSFMIQGFTIIGAYNISALIDIRKSSILFADRALDLGINTPAHMPYLNVANMLSSTTLSNNAIYQYINTTTPTSSTYVIGVDGHITKFWSAAVNIQQTNVTPTIEPSFIPTIDPVIQVQSTGSASNSINLRLTGVDIFNKHSTIDLLASFSADNITDSSAFIATYSKNINDVARIDFLIRHIEKNQPTIITTIDTGSIRINYKCSKSVSVESQLEFNTTVTTDKIVQVASTSYNSTFLIGIRYDF